MPSSRCDAPPASLALAAALVGLASPAHASYTFTTLNDPVSSYNSNITGINDLGQIVGYYGDIANQSVHGFEYDPSTNVFTTITGPNAARYTYLYGINDAGQVVGYTGASGFLYSLTSGTFTAISDPGGPTTPEGINNAGQIVGSFDFGTTSSGFLARYGFLDTAGTFTTILGPGQSTFTQAFGVNDAGQVVGSYTDAVTGRSRGFLDTGGVLTTINAPGAVFGTSLTGINKMGLLVGTYNDSNNTINGFVDNGGTFTTINAPGATGTYIRGVTNSGEIFGTYNIGFQQFGFVATPNAIPEPSPLALLALGLLPLGMVAARRRRTKS